MRQLQPDSVLRPGRCRTRAQRGAGLIVSTPALSDLRRYAVARSLFPPTTLPRAISKLGFVQADPIRAPARSQDLVLFHRVRNYRAGDLERRYTDLDIEEAFFVNYGFLPRATYMRMHPGVASAWSRAAERKSQAMLDFIRARGATHPRDADAHFAHGKTTNYWGGSSNATTHLLDGMHYRGLLRVERRERGVRVYAAREARRSADDLTNVEDTLDTLVDVIVGAYAPLPSASLSWLVGRLRYAVPQWAGQAKPALARARSRLGRAQVGGVEWYWPARENPASPRHAVPEKVRLLSPFDPVVWDRRRFAVLWDWEYRFEAYTPQAKRKLGYYALPLLWHDRVIGWGNVSLKSAGLECQFGFVGTRPRGRAFTRALDAELERIRLFLE